jgi:dCMP deaminase
MTDWRKRFFDQALSKASWSKDKDTKVGCIIVDDMKSEVASGYNGPPRGIEDTEEKLSRPKKYLYMVHAEANAIYQAARRGISLEGCILYTTLFPCCTCAQGIIQSGIKKVVTPHPNYNHPKYGIEWHTSHSLLLEAGIIVDFYNEEKDV